MRLLLIAASFLVLPLIASVHPVPAPGSDNPNDFGIPNPSMPWRQVSQTAAFNGACYGIVRVEVEYRRLGLHRQQSLRDATTPGSDSDRMFFEQAAATAQNYALRNRNLNGELYSQSSAPRVVDASLASSRPSEDNPQILLLTNEKAVPNGWISHAVYVSGRDDRGTTVRYTVHNPNPGSARELIYDKRTGSFQGYEGYDTVRHDKNPLPEKNQKWMEALTRGLGAPKGEQYVPAWRRDIDEPMPAEVYRRQMKATNEKKQDGPPKPPEKKKPVAPPPPPPSSMLTPPQPSEGLNRGFSALSASEVGGVRVYFDPALFADNETATRERWEMLRNLTDELTAGRENFLVRPGGSEEIEAVRLRAILAESATQRAPGVGGLTRIVGYVRNKDNGEFFILGRREPGRPAISLDVLTVALDLLWKRGATPAISLDPDPADFYGPQRVRRVEIPDEYKRSEFVRIMLDADYAMKLIMLGEDDLRIPGFRSSYDLLREEATGHKAEFVRWWLYPKETVGADVYETSTGSLESVYYPSDVRLLTETMKQANNMLIGTGGRDPQEERAALLFTQFYDEIATARPVFHQLHGLFDAAKLAAVLRARGVKSELLDSVARRPLAQVPVKDAYTGLGPKTVVAGTGTVYFIGGGVELESKVHAGDVINVKGLLTADALRPLANAGVNRHSLTAELPTTLPLDLQSAQRVNGNLESTRALGELMSGDIASALARLNRALAQDPSPRIRGVRAIARLFTGDFAGALKDADLVVPAMPSYRGIRGFLRVFAGDYPGALADVRAAALATPDREEVLDRKAWVEVQCLDLAAAEKSIARLAKLSPLNASLPNLRQEYRLFKMLGPIAARQYIKARLRLPMTTALLIGQIEAALQAGKIDEGVRLAERALALEQTRKSAGTQSLFLPERLSMLLAMPLMARNHSGDQKRARDLLAGLARQHPSWPSALLMQVDLDKQMPLRDAMALFRRAAAMPSAQDPLALEARGRLGVDLRGYVGFNLLGRVFLELDRRDSMMEPATARQFVKTVDAHTSSPTVKHFFNFMARGLDVYERMRLGKEPDAATKARLEKEFKDLLINVPAPPPNSDVTAAKALGALHKIASTMERGEQAMPHQESVFRKYAAALNSQWDLDQTTNVAAIASLQVHVAFAEALVDEISRRPEFLAAKREAGRSLPPEETQALLDRLTEAAIAQRKDLSRFSRTMLRILVEERRSNLLEKLDRRGEDSVRARPERFFKALSEAPIAAVDVKAAALYFDNQSQGLVARASNLEALGPQLAQLHAYNQRLNLRLTTGLAK